MNDHAPNPHVERAIKHAGKQQDLARLLGCAQQTVSKLLSGEIPMTADWALRIEGAVDGAVLAGDLHPPLARRHEPERASA